MSPVEIVIPMLKNCLFGHDIFKWHILFLEFKNCLENTTSSKEDFQSGQRRKLLHLVYLEEKIGGRRSQTYIAADVDAS